MVVRSLLLLAILISTALSVSASANSLQERISLKPQKRSEKAFVLGQHLAASKELRAGAGTSRLIEIGKLPAVRFHVAFAIIALVVLNLDLGSSGSRIFALVVGYNVALPAVAILKKYKAWFQLWLLIAPCSALMVLADWIQCRCMDKEILVYPDIGGPRIGPVNASMLGMWTIALFPVILFGYHVEEAKGQPKALAAVAIVGGLLFAAAEQIAGVKIWYTQNVRKVGNIGLFTFCAEVILSLTTLVAHGAAAEKPFPIKSLASALLMFIFTGVASIAYLLIDYIPGSGSQA